MSNPIDDLNIARIKPLIAPRMLTDELPASADNLELVRRSRHTIESILSGQDGRKLVIVGPCSVHDPVSALDYASRLAAARSRWEGLFVVMRVYFEKPRTVMGWKGLINDPDLDESFNIVKGLRLARKLLLDIGDLSLPAGTEFLDTTFGQYYADQISWAAIGARTAESQIHRELASGLSMPVGIKNRTDGNVQVALDAIRAAGQRHLFPSLTRDGVPAIFETRGNPNCHLILRGGTGPNYDAGSVRSAMELLERNGVPANIVIDCSHGNSEKDPRNQARVIHSVGEQISSGMSAIKGVMLESHLEGGRQNLASGDLKYGVSITDACLSLEETIPLLDELNEVVCQNNKERRVS